MRFACVGDNCVDRYLPPIGKRFAGGNAVNVAVQLRLMGHEVSYFGAIGGDEEGRFLRERLHAKALDLHGLQVLAGLPTAYTEIATDSGGDRHFIFEEFGAMAGYRPRAEDVERLLASDHVHIGWLNDGGALKRRLQSAGVSVSQDLSVNADPGNLSPEALSYAFVSASTSDADTAAERLLRRGAACAVVTMGPGGSLARRKGESASLGAEALEAVDTTGAGDSFIAGFLSAVLAGGRLKDGLRLGRERASLTCLHEGGFPQ